MTTLVMIDGQLLTPEAATISVFDRGFLYGDSVFETIRTYGGVPFALQEHVVRLKWSADRVFIPLPVPLETIADEVRQATQAAGNSESFIRIMLTRGRGAMGLDPGLAEHPVRVIIVAPLSTPPPETYERGVSVVTFRTQRFGDSTGAAGAKVGNYLVAVLAMRKAREANAAEALVVDHLDRIVEGSTSNVFAVKAGRLITPPEEVGILPGITRARVLAAARELGIDLEFRALSVSELEELEELFISSSIRELVPVVQVDAVRVGSGVPGHVTKRLLKRFREKIHDAATP